jgi:F-type H+-transporting ATPase subunit delta
MVPAIRSRQTGLSFMADSAASNSSHGVNIGQDRIGTIYARAFLGMAENAGKAEPLVQELNDLLQQVIEPHPELDRTLSSPRINVAEKRQLVDRILGGRVSDELVRFLYVVAEHGRMNCLREIRHAVWDQFQASRGTVRVQVTTAEPIANQLRDNIRETLAQKLGRNVELSVHVDPELVGGLMVRVGDTVFDGSIANQLRQLRVAAVERTYEQLRQNSHQLAGDLSL